MVDRLLVRPVFRRVKATAESRNSTSHHIWLIPLPFPPFEQIFLFLKINKKKKSCFCCICCSSLAAAEKAKQRKMFLYFCFCFFFIFIVAEWTLVCFFLLRSIISSLSSFLLHLTWRLHVAVYECMKEGWCPYFLPDVKIRVQMDCQMGNWGPPMRCFHFILFWRLDMGGNW